jgi:hypothetical protein
MTRNLMTAAAAFLMIVFVLTGCKRLPPPPEGLPKLYPCKITVTFGGEIIENVSVSLISADPNDKWKSGGKTDQTGTAVLRTSFAYTGVPEGTFTVCFEKTRENQGETIAGMTPTSLIPLKYRAGQSKETVEIKPGNNEFTFTLDGGEEQFSVPNIAVPFKRR